MADDLVRRRVSVSIPARPCQRAEALMDRFGMSREEAIENLNLHGSI
jgi:hypothetical protein